MEQILEYGPYTPQEADRVTKWLKDKQISFSLIKDEQAEKLAMMNDGQTVVNRLSYRSDVYLGQIFFFQLQNLTVEAKEQFEKEFAVKSENLTAAQSQSLQEDDQNLTAKRMHKQKLKKRFWAGLFASGMIAVFVYSIINLLTRS